MKKYIWIGCGVLVLSALIWVGARNLSATAETDVSADDVTADAGNSDDGKKVLTAPKAFDSDLDKETSDGESDDAGNVDNADSGAGTEDAAEAENLDGESAAGDNDAGGENTVSVSSDEDVLYTIKTSSGSNLGMVPVVGGNAVVLMDGSYTTIYQGDYTPEEQIAFNLKLEEKKNQAASAGKIEAWAFYREAMLYDFTFPEGVTDIEKFAFARSSLSSVSIPEGVTRIGYGAFYHCDALSDVTIPASVTVIEENAFSHTPWLDNWMAGGTEPAEDAETAEATVSSGPDDFLIVGDGILLAYRGHEADPELPAEVKSVVPGVFAE